MSLREKKMEKKKQDILRSAAEVVNEKGYHGTTMEEIAAKLLMTKGSLYYYYKNKEEILYECHSMILDISLSQIQEIVNSALSPQEKLESMIKKHVLLELKETAMFRIIDNPDQTFSGEYLQEIRDKRAQYAHWIDQILIEGIEKSCFAPLDVKMVRFIILGALNWIQQWYSANGPRTDEEIAQIFADYLMRMIKV